MPVEYLQVQVLLLSEERRRQFAKLPLYDEARVMF